VIYTKGKTVSLRVAVDVLAVSRPVAPG